MDFLANPILTLQSCSNVSPAEWEREHSVLCQLSIDVAMQYSFRLLPVALVFSGRNNFSHWLNCIKAKVLQLPLFFPLFSAPAGKDVLEEYMEEAKVSIAKKEKRRLPQRMMRLLKINEQSRRNLWRQQNRSGLVLPTEPDLFLFCNSCASRCSFQF